MVSYRTIAQDNQRPQKQFDSGGGGGREVFAGLDWAGVQPPKKQKNKFGGIKQPYFRKKTPAP